MVQNMSRPGNCWENAVAESFFSARKKERIKRRISPGTKRIPTYSITSRSSTTRSAGIVPLATWPR